MYIISHSLKKGKGAERYKFRKKSGCLKAAASMILLIGFKTVSQLTLTENVLLNPS